MFQGPMLFEDLAVYFSQEESVSLHPALRSLSRDTTPECFEGMALIGKAVIFLAFWNFGQSCPMIKISCLIHVLVWGSRTYPWVFDVDIIIRTCMTAQFLKDEMTFKR